MRFTVIHRRLLIIRMDIRPSLTGAPRLFTPNATNARFLRHVNRPLAMREKCAMTYGTRHVPQNTFRRFPTTSRLNNRTKATNYRKFRRERQLSLQGTNGSNRVRLLRVLRRIRATYRSRVFRLRLLRRYVTFFHVILVIRTTRSIRPSIKSPKNRFGRHVSRNLSILSKDRARRYTGVRPTVLLFRQSVTRPLVLSTI